MKTKFWNGSFLRTVLQCLAIACAALLALSALGAGLWLGGGAHKKDPPGGGGLDGWGGAFSGGGWGGGEGGGSVCLPRLRLRVAALLFVSWPVFCF